MASESKCPVLGGPQAHTTAGAPSNRDWWPNQLNLKILHQNSPLSDPMDEEFNYAEEFKTLDLDALKKDLKEVMTTSHCAATSAIELPATAPSSTQAATAVSTKS